VAGALDSAHHQGVVHRDIKPENILLHEGEAVLADFGIALAVKQAAGNRLTETGLSLGTPQYMSPEQVTGDRQLDARSDVYSLAAVLYEMLTGEPPHSGPSVQAVIAKLMTERPTRLRVLRGTVPEGVDNAVARALATLPVDRFGSAGEFAAALHAPGIARATRFRPSPRMVGVTTVAAVLAVVVLVALKRGQDTTPVLTRQLTFTGKVTNSFTTGSTLAISPDGNRVAYVSAGRQLVVQAIDGGEPTTLVADARFLAWPRWTRDGMGILFVMFRDSLEQPATYLVPAAGGPARKVIADQTPIDPGPDSQSVVRVPWERHALEIVDLRSGRATGAVPLPDSLFEHATTGFSNWTDVRAAPNGRWVAVSADPRWWLVPLARGAALQLLPEGRAFAWSTGSDFLYFLTGDRGAVDLRRVAVDSRTGRLGRPKLVRSLPNATDFDVGPGDWVVYMASNASSQVYAWSMAGGPPGQVQGLHPVTEGTRPAGTAAISDDGTRIAFSRPRGTDLELEVAPFGGGQSLVVAASSSPEQNPSWSPDGSLLAFFRDDSLMVVAPSADATPRRVGTARGTGPAAWSADGRTIAYLTTNRGPVELVDLATGTERELPIPDSVGTAWTGAYVLSPDGRELLISTVFQARDWWTLWHLDVVSNRWTHLLQMPILEWFPFRWNRDGWIYLFNDRGTVTDYGTWRAEVWRMRGPHGRAEFVAPLPDLCEYAPSRGISRDGRHAACRSVRIESDLYVVGPGPRHAP
jgi:serine/threonine-protein kinase